MSFARLPNGSGEFTITDLITFGYNNDEFISSVASPNHRMVVYPNPTNDFLKLGSDNSLYDVNCYTLSGPLLFSASQVNYLDVSNLKSGIYPLQFSDGGFARFSVLR